MYDFKFCFNPGSVPEELTTENVIILGRTCSSSSISRIRWIAAPPVKDTSSATTKISKKKWQMQSQIESKVLQNL